MKQAVKVSLNLVIDYALQEGAERVHQLNRKVPVRKRRLIEEMAGLKQRLADVEGQVYADLERNPPPRDIIGFVHGPLPSQAVLHVELPGNPTGNRARDTAVLRTIIAYTQEAMEAVTGEDYEGMQVERHPYSTSIHMARTGDKILPTVLSQRLNEYMQENRPELLNVLNINVSFQPMNLHREEARQLPDEGYGLEGVIQPGTITEPAYFDAAVEKGYRIRKEDVPQLINLDITYEMAEDTKILHPEVTKKVWAGYLAGQTRQHQGTGYRLPDKFTIDVLARKLKMHPGTVSNWKNNPEHPLRTDRDDLVTASGVRSYLRHHPRAKTILENKGIKF